MTYEDQAGRWFKVNLRRTSKTVVGNPAYGRHKTSRRVRLVAPIPKKIPQILATKRGVGGWSGGLRYLSKYLQQQNILQGPKVFKSLADIGAKPNIYSKAKELVCGGSPMVCVLVERKA